MELMGDGLIAILAAVGVSTILWLLAETLLRRHSPVAEAVLVLPVRGDGATLERALHLTMEQRATGETPILLADCVGSWSFWPGTSCRWSWPCGCTAPTEPMRCPVSGRTPICWRGSATA